MVVYVTSILSHFEFARLLIYQKVKHTSQSVEPLITRKKAAEDPRRDREIDFEKNLEATKKEESVRNQQLSLTFENCLSPPL